MFRVHAAECHSLKAALKAIIQRGTASVDIDSEDEELHEMREVRLPSYVEFCLTSKAGASAIEL
jgi:hypothetical protein